MKDLLNKIIKIKLSIFCLALMATTVQGQNCIIDGGGTSAPGILTCNPGHWAFCLDEELDFCEENKHDYAQTGTTTTIANECAATFLIGYADLGYSNLQELQTALWSLENSPNALAMGAINACNGITWNVTGEAICNDNFGTIELCHNYSIDTNLPIFKLTGNNVVSVLSGGSIDADNFITVTSSPVVIQYCPGNISDCPFGEFDLDFSYPSTSATLEYWEDTSSHNGNPTDCQILGTYNGTFDSNFASSEVAPCIVCAAYFSDAQCDNNMTPTEPTDDVLVISNVNFLKNKCFFYGSSCDPIITVPDHPATGEPFTATWTETDTGFDIIISPYPTFVYNIDVTVDFSNCEDSGSGEPAGCTTITFPTPGIPGSCADPCMFNSGYVGNMCNDNGTPTDPSDDFVSFQLDVPAGAGTGSSTTYTVAVSGHTVTPSMGNIGELTTFQLEEGSAGGTGNLEILITEDHPSGVVCEGMLSLLYPGTCSDMAECSLEEPVVAITCNDEGTTLDPSDDTFTYTITVSGTSTATTYTITGSDSQTGTYGVPETFGPFLISNGDLMLTITDDADPNCATMISVMAPPTCSNSCTLEPMIRVECNDNGTPTDDADDIFEYYVIATGSNTGASYSVSGDDSQTALAYGIEHGPFGMFPISSGNISLTLTDIDDISCTVTESVAPPPSCSGGCNIDTPIIEVTCLDNGTPNDPSDDEFEYSINVSGTGVGASYGVTGDDTQSGLLYGQVQGTFGPFPISGGNLMISIGDISRNCMTNAIVEAPEPCQAACSLMSPMFRVECQDNSTPTDPSDDTFNYYITVGGDGTSATYSVGGGDTQIGLAYDVENGPFGSFNITDGDLNLVITDTGDINCTTTGVVLAPPPCSNACELNMPAILVTCLENGTPADDSDDQFEYTIELYGTNVSTSYSISGDDTQTNIPYGLSGPYGPFPIVGGSLSITVADDVDTNCSLSTTVMAPSPCSQSCSMNTPMTRTVCNDNGTPVDPSDDFYQYYVIVTASNGSTYSVSGADSQSGLAYGIEHGPFGNFLISGGDVSITLLDDNDNLCTVDTRLVAPINCATPCILLTPNTRVVCLDNGTPNLTSDDQYEYYITVLSATGTGATYSITGSDTQTALPYDVEQGPFGAFDIIANPSLMINVKDDAAMQCEINATINAPVPCSIDCEEFLISSRTVCNDNGTLTDTSDDVFDYYITIETTSNTGTYSISGSDTQGSLAYGVEQGPFGTFAISGGALALDITDDITNNCTGNTTIAAPTPCSNGVECAITVVDVRSECNNNGTPTDDIDDYFEYYITTTSVAGGSTYAISGDDSQTGLAYGIEQGPFGSFVITGGDLMIRVFDEGTPSCETNAVVNAPESCSADCAIADVMLRVECNDNGTPSDDLDDVYSYYILATGVNVGSTYSISGTDTQSGLAYNVEHGPFGTFEISSGGLVLTITDIDNPSCTANVTIDNPNPCSTNCALLSPLISTECIDNGTPSDSSDDRFNYSIRVSGVNIGTTYDISGDDIQNGILYGTLEGPFGSFPINGGDLMLTINDSADTNCSINAAVMAPNSCSTSCIINGVNTRQVCNDNGTPTNPLDDTYEYYIIAMSINGSGTYSVLGDDTQLNLAYNVEHGPFGAYSIGDGDLSLNVVDDVYPDCSYSIVVLAPEACSDEECVPEEYTICNDGSNSAELFADQGLTDIQWYNEAGILVGETNTILIVSSDTPGMEDGSEAFSYTTGIEGSCVGNSCCPVIINTEVCCPTADCLSVTVTVNKK